MSWQTNTFIGVLTVLVLGTAVLSYTGILLPSSDAASSVSLRNVQARRTHFVRHYAFGK